MPGRRPTTAANGSTPDLSPPAPASSAVGALLWADEFDGAGVDRSQWGFDLGGGGWGNGELEYYTDRADNALVQAGTLQVIAKCEQYAGYAYTSARMRTVAAWGPGIRVEVRARMPTGRGSWPAIWMMPRDSVYGNWPNSGEIDIMEALGCDPTLAHGSVHTQGGSGTATIAANLADWVTYALEWEDSQMRWYVNGQLYLTYDNRKEGSVTWPFDQPFYLILNVAVASNGFAAYCLSGVAPSCSDPTQFGTPQIMEVDYARVYALA